MQRDFEAESWIVLLDGLRLNGGSQRLQPRTLDNRNLRRDRPFWVLEAVDVPALFYLGGDLYLSGFALPHISRHKPGGPLDVLRPRPREQARQQEHDR